MYINFNILLVILIIISAIILNVSKSPINSILYLIFIFLLSVILLLQIGAEFIAVVIFIVYVGAISILFLFIIMMLNIRIVDIHSYKYNYIPIGGFIGVLTLFECVQIFYSERFFFGVHFYNDFYKVIENYTIFSNINLIGQLLFNYYFHLFIVVSFLLLVAMLGSIVLTDYFRIKPIKDLKFIEKKIIVWKI